MNFESLQSLYATWAQQKQGCLKGMRRDGQNQNGPWKVAVNLQRPTTCCRAPACLLQTKGLGFDAAIVSDIWRDRSSLHSYPPTLAPTIGTTTVTVTRLPTLSDRPKRLHALTNVLRVWLSWLVRASRPQAPR